MLSRKLKEYLQTKEAPYPSAKRQYDFQIRKKVNAAFDDIELILTLHSEKQIKKILNQERIPRLLKILETTLKVNDTISDESTLKVRFKTEITAELRTGQDGCVSH